MKKAAPLLLALVGVFCCLIVGIFIGRNSIAGMVVIPEVATERAYFPEETTYTDEEVPITMQANDGKININTASVSVLQNLPNIGLVLAQRIVDYRNANGNFTAVEDLLLIEEIGEKRLEQIRDYITVGG